MLIFRVARVLEEAGVDFAVCGGYAVALHGAVRGTVDVDIVLRLDRKNFVAAETALNTLGLVSRLPVGAAQVFDFREEYLRDRNLRAWSFWNPKDQTEIVDVVLTRDLASMKVTRVRSGAFTLPVVSIIDLIAMKKAAGRPQDLEEVRALKALRKP